MIFDSLENIHLYRSLSENFSKAVDYILSIDLENLDVGRYEVDESIYAMVQTPNLLPFEQQRYENHKKYLDIQLVISGHETMYCRQNGLTLVEQYDAEKDIAFYSGERGIKLDFGKNDFVIYFPQDAHAPCCSDKATDISKKLVVKVRC